MITKSRKNNQNKDKKLKEKNTIKYKTPIIKTELRSKKITPVSKITKPNK